MQTWNRASMILNTGHIGFLQYIVFQFMTFTILASCALQLLTVSALRVFCCCLKAFRILWYILSNRLTFPSLGNTLKQILTIVMSQHVSCHFVKSTEQILVSRVTAGDFRMLHLHEEHEPYRWATDPTAVSPYMWSAKKGNHQSLLLFFPLRLYRHL
jgi:hypothetical protein